MKVFSFICLAYLLATVVLSSFLSNQKANHKEINENSHFVSKTSRKTQQTLYQSFIVGPGNVSTACLEKIKYSYVSLIPEKRESSWEILLNENSSTTLLQENDTNSFFISFKDYQNTTEMNITAIINSDELIDVVQVHKEKQPIFFFPEGRKKYAKIGQVFKIQGEISDYCDVGESITWKWKLDGKTATSLAEEADTLIMEMPILDLTKDHYIMATASSGGYSSSETLDLIIVESELVIVLSRFGGPVRSDQDFIISADSSYDPDNLNSYGIDFFWEYYDINGSSIGDSKESELSIEKSILQSYDFININLTITSGSRTNNKAISISPSSSITSNIIANHSYTPVRSIREVLDIKGDSTYELEWSEKTHNINIALKNISILIIPENQLTMGNTYNFVLNIKSSKEDYSIEIEINTFTPPSCIGNLAVQPKSGTFLSDIFTFTISDCYPVDETGFPLTYSIIGSVDGIMFSLSDKSYWPEAKSYLLVDTKDYYMSVCDSTDICQNFHDTVTVLSQVHYEASTSDIYYEEGLHSVFSLIPTIDLDLNLLYTIWKDLKDYYNAAYDKNKISHIFLGITNKLVQNENFLYNHREDIIQFLLFSLDSFDIDSDLMDLCGSITSHLVSLYKTHTKYVNSTSDFIYKSLKKFTINSPPTYSYQYISDKINIYKFTNSLNYFLSKTFTIENRTIELPSTLSTTEISSSSIVNFYILLHKNAGNYSDILDFSFSTSGTFQNFSYSFAEEKTVELKKLPKPIKFTLKNHDKVLNEWNCAYLSADLWYNDGCKITSEGNESITFTFNHSSTISLVDLMDLSKLPPPIYIDDTTGCGTNYMPIWILIAFTFALVIFIPLAIWLDKINPPEQEQFQPIPNKNMSGEFSIHEGEISASDSERSGQVNMSGDYEIAAKKQSNTRSSILILFEGHLTFGLVLTQKNFNRFQRILSLHSVIILSLFIQGGLLYGLEVTSKNNPNISKDYFKTYKSIYFGYTIISVAISFCFEVIFTILFSLYGKMRSFGVYTGVVLIAVIVAGSIIGTIYLALNMCDDWSAYWSISFFWGILIEIIILQTVAMIVRFCIVKRG
ncbi:hypothetical protein SteCoe_21350 [Stentor coeruleus]|uniref:PKD/REJ-like domain-containing protein n=1 Tax=Stentor coeruleus TaxID=5963 RepID=A0A1R2BPY2_9CILI|nr:hypothetical protein SteCoe_21350 [Stentor coeruleus]